MKEYTHSNAFYKCTSSICSKPSPAVFKVPTDDDVIEEAKWAHAQMTAKEPEAALVVEGATVLRFLSRAMLKFLSSGVKI